MIIMKRKMIGLYAFVIWMMGNSLATASSATLEIWVAQSNFLDHSMYQEDIELSERPSKARCGDSRCDYFMYGDMIYYRAVLITEENYKNILIGTWSADNCRDDLWQANTDNTFRSQFPMEDGMYSWQGNFSFENNLYKEDGTNNRDGKEINYARLYYLPAEDLIIYKGIKSFDHYNEDGSVEFFHYIDKEFPYVSRCRK